jgi:hypothetical protein
LHAPRAGLRKPAEETGRADRGVSATRRVVLAPRPARASTQAHFAHAHTHCNPAHEAGCALLTPAPVCNARPVGAGFQSAKLRACDPMPDVADRPARAHARQAHATVCARSHAYALVCACRTACLHLCVSSLSSSPRAFGRICGPSKIPCVVSKIAIGSVAS